MTNADKYLKDGVDVEELASEINELMLFCQNYTQPFRAYLVEFFNKPVKQTLTEDEKVILSHINTDIYAKIGKYKNGEIIFRNINDSYIVLTPYFKFENMFQFIQPRRRI